MITLSVFSNSVGKNVFHLKVKFKGKILHTVFKRLTKSVCKFICIVSVCVCVCVLREFAVPSWAVAALCTVSLCVVLSCAVCVWKKCLKKKDKDKEKDKKKGKEKSKGGFDTEMDGGYSEVGYTNTHTHRPPLQMYCPCNVSQS